MAKHKFYYSKRASGTMTEAESLADAINRATVASHMCGDAVRVLRAKKGGDVEVVGDLVGGRFFPNEATAAADAARASAKAEKGEVK